MRLDTRSSSTSFYETFSDLMFSTLIIFVLIVLILVVQFKASINEVLSPNRFVGGESGQLSVGLVRVDGDPHVAFIPRSVANTFGVNHTEPKDGGDVVWAWSKYLGGQGASDGVFTIPIEEWDTFSPALRLREPTAGQVGIQCVMPHFSTMVPLQVVCDGLFGGGPIRQGPDQIYDRLGGHDFRGHEQTWDDMERFYPDAYGARLLNPLLASGYGGSSAIQQPSGESYLRFRVTEDRAVILGDHRCEPKDLRNILRSITPSMDFYLEFISDDPASPAPPEWVVTEILQPVGWDRRVIADQYRVVGGGGG